MSATPSPPLLEALAESVATCYERKGPNLTGVDPDTSTVVALFHPRRDRWEEHFAWNELEVAGRTCNGRATAWLMEMNSDERVRGREALRRYGLL